MIMKIDEKDHEILELLEKDASLTKKQIAKKLSLPLTTVHNRISKLEKEKVILGYKAKIDKKKLGLSLPAYVGITVKYLSPNYSQEKLAQEIAKCPEVEEVSIMAGETDIIAKVRVKDADSLNDFLIKRLRILPSVDKTNTMVVIKEIK